MPKGIVAYVDINTGTLEFLASLSVYLSLLLSSLEVCGLIGWHLAVVL